jgi:predicted acetyltransferase
MQIKTTPAIRLVQPSAKYRESYLAGLQEMTSDADKWAWIYLGESVPTSLPVLNFDLFLKTLIDNQQSPPPGFVQGTVYWALHHNEIVGRIGIRHELNEFLRTVGGHIGYIVRPLYRNKGVASEMLKQLLATEVAKQIGSLLLTCDENNFASEKTILKNGGIFEGIVDDAAKGRRVKRFWIHLSA